MQTSAQSQLLWWLALATGALVIIVVATLLTLVLTEASAIAEEAQIISHKARSVSLATIKLLYALRINSALTGVGDGAGAILRQAGRVVVHVQSCPGCPNCRSPRELQPSAVRPKGPGPPGPSSWT
ncbi:MAG: hypothetical protein JF887_06920 [Candidatus Dormibacteraeota bacterium]|uniref:Uncharacterized protein n=1 Tax=Candidatus Amunia macphersoniae TaxID=3127014 RepID=A0A934KET0_9BACT|nr:hypothetical protein [Candidatus Dormibacteraeota bacterium]